MAAKLLPIFPLSVVLLPTTPLPLHIFEDRYKEMMGEVIQTKEEFGVVLAKNQGIVNVGCTATIDRIFQRYPDGRLDLLAIGRRRFRVMSLDEEKPYLRAGVEYFNDEEATEPAVELRQLAIQGYRLLREIEKPEVVIEPQLNAPQLSFQLTQFISDVDKRQTVLALRSEIERLQFLVAIFPDYLRERQQITIAKRLAPTNGHAKHVQNL